MTCSPIIIRLAGEPKGKARPRFSRASGRAFTPAHTAKYEAALRVAAQDAMGERPPLTEALAVIVTAAMPIAASWSKVKQQRARDGLIRPTNRPDADNYAKSLDGLNEVVFRDDAQIVELTVRKIFSDKPELRIEVAPIAGAAA